MTAQPPRFHLSALWVTTHGQQVALLGGSYPYAVSIFYNPSQQGTKQEWFGLNLGALAMKEHSTQLYGLRSYPGHLSGRSYLFAEMQSVYSTTPADWASKQECYIII